MTNAYELYPEIKWLLDHYYANGATPFDLKAESIRLHNQAHLLAELTKWQYKTDHTIH